MMSVDAKATRRRSIARSHPSIKSRQLVDALESRLLLSSTLEGSVDVFTGAEIAGWAFDTATPSTAITVQISIDGGAATNVVANQSRPDLKPALGTDKVGFFYVPTLTPGNHTVTVSEVDPTNGQATVLKTGTVKSGPIGSVDILQGAVVAGWAFDSAAPSAALTIHVTIDGTVHTLTTGAPRPDVGGPLGNPNVGFFYDPPALSAGAHSIKVAVVDVQTGQDVTLATGSVTSGPIGSIDIATLTHVQGWIYDPVVRDNPVNVRVLVDGVANASGVAGGSRPDIAVAFNNDPNHGYSINLSNVSAGSHTLQVVEVNGDGSTTPVVTQSLTDTVIGSVDIANPGSVAGWAFDPFAPSTPISIVLNLDGVDSATVTANQARPDLTALPDPNHGYSTSTPTNQAGSHTLQVFAINPDTQARTLLGKRTFVNNAPAGAIQAASSSSISGYAYDPDVATTPVQILLYLDGTAAGKFSDGTLLTNTVANINDPSLTPIIGSPNHHFDIPISGLSAGSHTLTIFAADPQTGITTLIGTSSITA